MDGIGKDLTQIAFMFGSIAVIALLVSHAQETATIINSGGKTFGGLLGIVTLQDQYQNLFSM